MFAEPEKRDQIFGIRIDPEYRDDVRHAWHRVRLSALYRPADLTAHDAARTELVLYLAERLQQRGVPRPLKVAWDLVGDADPELIAVKLQPGQPLGDLSRDAVLGQFAPLVNKRLKVLGAAGGRLSKETRDDARSAAILGLLEALGRYDPSIDASVGTFAEMYRYIDRAIKDAIHGYRAKDDKYTDALGRSGQVQGDHSLVDSDGESVGTLWDITPKTAFPYATTFAIEKAHDNIGRFRRNRLPFATALWLTEISNRVWRPAGHGA